VPQGGRKILCVGQTLRINKKKGEKVPEVAEGQSRGSLVLHRGTISREKVTVSPWVSVAKRRLSAAGSE